MSDYGLSNEGFKRKRLDMLLLELNNEVKSIFGDNFNVSPESPDGQINGVIAESNANLWEIAEASYNAFNPSAASGVSLSNLVQLNGITRLPSTSSRVQLSIIGVPGTIVPAGSLVSTNDIGNQFATENEVTIEIGNVSFVYASAVLTGPINGLDGTITRIDTPITGWTSVTNTLDALLGTNEETDVELRARREKSVARDAQAMVDAIFAAIANIEGVTQIVVLENDTNVTDTNGLPPHSFQVIVVGGNDIIIGDTIWLKKPAGVLSFGTTTVEILDSQGLGHDISFSRPTTVPIYVIVNLTTFSDYPVDGDALIKQSIVDYANGNLVEGRGFSLSEDVIHSRLYTPVNSIQGHEVNSIFIGTSASPTLEDNIAISITETSQFLITNIIVNS